MKHPAIVAVGYNRPDSMKRLLTSIGNAYYPFEEIDLIISIDESNRSDEVQQVAENFIWEHGNKIIKRYPERLGLRKHIISCGDLSSKYDAVVILEDDLMVSPSFYIYVWEALQKYRDDPHVAGIALYSHRWNEFGSISFAPVHNQFDAFFAQFSVTWGQCWTKEQWQGFKKWYIEKEDRLPEVNYTIPRRISSWGTQSWGKYFISYIVEKGLYYVMPYTALSTNFSEIGEHCSVLNVAYQLPIQEGKREVYYFPNYEQAIKYDAFFERKFDGHINGIDGSEICVNLNGMRLSTLGKKYFITTKKIRNLVPLKTYGMMMRPIDANIEHEIDGEDIFLYHIEDQDIKLDERQFSLERINYETYGLLWNMLLVTGWKKFVFAVQEKLKRMMK